MSGVLKLRIEPGDAGESWKRSEGRTVADKFQLLKYIAGSDDSAVFLTSINTESTGSQEAAIKLIYADAAEAEKQLRWWALAREMTHSNLLQIFEAGRCEIDGMRLLYVVQEYAEENVAEILPDRALTVEETRELLPPVLEVLRYLHERDFAHGRLQPSNILAVGNQVKLSSDALIPVGEKGRRRAVASVYIPPESASDAVSEAADAWQLGLVLIEILTQHLPAWDRALLKSPEIPRSMPEPFREIAKHCLQVEPAERWTIVQVLNHLTTNDLTMTTSQAVHLESRAPTLALVQNESYQTEQRQTEPVTARAVVSGRQKRTAKWPYLVVAFAALIAVGLFLIIRPKASAPTSAVQSLQQPSSTPTLTKADSNPGTPNPTNGLPQEGVVRRVVPDVLPAARRTIHGRIVVRVKVTVDAAGDVTNATLQSGRESRYFSRIALESAREWKFAPRSTGQSGDRQWNLQFAFTRAKTDVSATAINR